MIEEDLKKALFSRSAAHDGPLETPCLMWLGGWSSFGHGLIYWKGKQLSVHRLSWEIHIGAIPINLQVLHHCDNPWCIAIDHLFLGTQKDNMDDAQQKGRRYFPPKIITAERKVELFQLRSEGWSYNRLAAKYGVTKQTIYKHVKGLM